MKPNPDLWRRLQAFNFDPEGRDGRFLSKLARDNGWHIPYARRVVEEYRRYAFLCCTAGHMVVPSEQVDQAWHQHLLDTQPYWEVFCRQVLGRPLHHRPSSGSLEDRRRHIAMYQRTLASYAEAFGHASPADIWPPASQRFGRDLRQRRVRLADYWLIPRRPVLQAGVLVLALAAGLAIVGAAPRYGSTTPLGFDGPTFLKFYVVVVVAALVVSLVLRARLLNPRLHAAPGAFDADRSLELDRTRPPRWRRTRARPSTPPSPPSSATGRSASSSARSAASCSRARATAPFAIISRRMICCRWRPPYTRKWPGTSGASR